MQFNWQFFKVMVIQTNKGKTGGIQAPAQNWKKLCEKCNIYLQMKFEGKYF